ncbi:unnamed protein product [Paramecium sonneborni]|uniref:Transmembrane protein n=1 Tax=Paramecium sonneborni TaxID=65129 RepID=A0A8S1N2K1_9CILI|nr:unnamed protein product [Paramecium sonneborni]
MLQVYLVRYDCLKIQQLIPNRIFCILFYAICIIDLILLLFSCSFFILPFQQEDIQQQFIIEKESTDWTLSLQQTQFGRQPIIGQLNNQQFAFIQINQDPYLNIEKTKLFAKTNFHEFFGYIDYKLPNLMLPKVYCMQLQILKRQTQKIIKNLPQCKESKGIPITPWFWKGENIYYLAEMCFKISIQDYQLQFEGGCFEDGLIYKKLHNDEIANFQNLSMYLRHVDDPYLHRVQFPGEPIQTGILSLNSLYYSFLFGCSGTIYLILIYLILSIRKRNENQYV